MKKVRAWACSMLILPLYTHNALRRSDPVVPRTVGEHVMQVHTFLREHARNGKDGASNEHIRYVFDDNLRLWRTYFNDWDVHRLLAAVVFGVLKHEGLFRYDALESPYFIHPLRVALLVLEDGVLDKCAAQDIIIAALLHDTLEDTKTTAGELELFFGPRVRALVEEVTDPDFTTYPDHVDGVDLTFQSDTSFKKYTLQTKRVVEELTPDAQIIKLADRADNMRDLRYVWPRWDNQEILNYYGWGVKLAFALKDKGRYYLGLAQRIRRFVHDGLEVERRRQTFSDEYIGSLMPKAAHDWFNFI